MKLEANTISEYQESAPEARRSALRLVDARTMALSPEADATFQHGMPFYTLAGEPYIVVASHCYHLSLYVVGLDGLLDARDDLSELVAGLDRGKNCLRFRDSQLDRLTPDLLDPIIRGTKESRMGAGH
jgi:hypothetical protein